MNDLMQIVIGWLGYLERPTILLQLLLVAAAAALLPALLQRRPGRRWRRGRESLLGLGLLALGCLLLRLLQAPTGLAETLGWL
ncbi:MAG: hypothetical protein ACKOPS_00620 [Cyanobium sp.]